MVKQRGFTLLEILVAIAIAAVLVGIAVLNINLGGREAQLKEEANRLTALLRLAADEAVFSGRELGLRMRAGSYEFLRLGSEGDKWTALSDDKRLRQRVIPEGLEIEMEIEGVPIVLDSSDREDARTDPQVMLLSNGEVIPDYAIILRAAEIEYSFRISSGEETPIVMAKYDF